MNAAVFHQAVADGDATKVKFLINIGQQARVNQVNKQGLTALQQSCKDGKLDVVHVLLNHGANIALMGRKDRTALHYAAAGGYKDIVELLISSCADVSVKDKEGNLPADVAKTEQIAELLAKAENEKKAKVRERSNSKNEDWGQHFKSLPPGHRNSLVSNSSSDSGVFTEDSTTSSSRSTESRSTKNGNRGVISESRPTMGVLNEGEECIDERRSSYTAETRVEAAPPKLRRSMSERLPAHRRKRSLGRLSEELSALNLARVVSQEYYEEDELEEQNSCEKNARVLRGRDIKNDYITRRDDFNYSVNNDTSSMRKLSNEVFLPVKNQQADADKDEGWEDDDELENTAPILAQKVRDDAPQARAKGCDELEMYRRSQRENIRNSRRRTLDGCEVSHEKWNVPHSTPHNDEPWLTGQQPRRPSYNEQLQHYSIQPAQDHYDPYCVPNVTRTLSSCSETEIRKYYHRLEAMSENRLNNNIYVDTAPYPTEYNKTKDYCDFQNMSKRGNLPGYEESLRRLRSERVRRPPSRQISQV